MNEKLTKRDYLGEGFFYIFIDEKGNFSKEECTEEEYLKLGEVDGHLNNPIRESLTFHAAMGGTVKVDTLDFELGLNEYTDLGDKYFVQKGFTKETGYYEKSEIINDEIVKK